MSIDVRIIEDSVSPEDIRLATFQLRYPRIIHSELMTHRVFSRNASSSRAIPVQRQIKAIINDPAEPVEWGSNQKGMQAGDPLTGWRLWLTQLAWHGARHGATACARLAVFAGAHKQVANRILEPWSHISVVLTATDFANWFALRDHKDADPTIRALADRMRRIYNIEAPTLLQPGQWHLPYVHAVERHDLPLEDCLRMSAARCGRVSYLTHEGQKPSVQQDLDLFTRLMGGDPKHASPTEHQGTPDKRWKSRNRWAHEDEHGNFRGWRQHRKMIPGEAVQG